MVIYSNQNSNTFFQGINKNQQNCKWYWNKVIPASTKSLGQHTVQTKKNLIFTVQFLCYAIKHKTLLIAYQLSITCHNFQDFRKSKYLLRHRTLTHRNYLNNWNSRILQVFQEPTYDDPKSLKIRVSMENIPHNWQQLQFEELIKKWDNNINDAYIYGGIPASGY